MMVTLRNDFHNTTARVRYNPGVPLTDRQVKRAAKQLCGITGCCCSDGTGIRGPQDVKVDVEPIFDDKYGYRVVIGDQQTSRKGATMEFVDIDEPEPVRLEVCCNAEWLRMHCLDVEHITEHDENDAANDFADRLFGKLDRLEYETQRAHGQRATFHGWNGCNTFTHKLGPVGTFNDLDGAAIKEIERCIDEARRETEEVWCEFDD